MRRTEPDSPRLPRQQISEMLQPHLCAFHLSHIQKYHAARQKLSKSYDKLNPQVEAPSKRFQLPVYLLAVHSGEPFRLRKSLRNGWIQCLDWRDLLPAVVEVRADSRIVCVTTGAAAVAQHRMIERILQQKTRKKKIAIVSVPVLHFRGVTYLENGKQFVVPIRSPMVRFRLGTSYKAESVLHRFRKGVDHRVAAANRGAQLLTRRRKQERDLRP